MNNSTCLICNKLLHLSSDGDYLNCPTVNNFLFGRDYESHYWIVCNSRKNPTLQRRMWIDDVQINFSIHRSILMQKMGDISTRIEFDATIELFNSLNTKEALQNFLLLQ